MILVVDSGSTKCDWMVLDRKGKKIHELHTPGINPLILSDVEIQKIIIDACQVIKEKDSVTKIRFYGAGCTMKKINQKMKRLLGAVFKNADHIDIHEDIIAAAHAATQSPGVICILGTGSNCCYYDGTQVLQKIPALGYLLMDEGSGNFFGKELLKSYYQKKMPAHLSDSFEKEFDLNQNKLLQQLYSTDSPNRYLASYVRFAFQHRGHSFIEEMLEHGITEFLETYLLHYEEELRYCPVHFVGSVAYYTQNIINRLLEERGYHAKSFIKKPIDNLINYIVNENILNKTY